MPARDVNGQPTGRGTQLEVDPPINLLLWVKGKGAYVQDAGGAQEAFKADVGGWFDQKLATFNSSKLSDVVRQFSSTPAPTCTGGNAARKSDSASASARGRPEGQGLARGPGRGVRRSGRRRRDEACKPVVRDPGAAAVLAGGGTGIGTIVVSVS